MINYSTIVILIDLYSQYLINTPLLEFTIQFSHELKHICSHCSTFGTRGGLNLDISLASYTITPIYFLISLIYSTGISVGDGTAGGGPHNPPAATV